MKEVSSFSYSFMNLFKCSLNFSCQSYAKLDRVSEFPMLDLGGDNSLGVTPHLVKPRVRITCWVGRSKQSPNTNLRFELVRTLG